ncbi:MAG: hypothetical protein Q8904_12325 [Bacteroidota bacterium]|nr:hypothetical protein [Bacteroidota bacterium]
MKRLIKNITCQCLIFFLIVQTLNLSINSVDFYSPSQITNSVDDQDYVDSMIEFLVENVLGYSKSTFHDKAYADNNSKQQQNSVHIDLKCFPDSLVIFDLEAIQKEIAHIVPQNDRIIILFSKEVRPNPPQLLSV